MNMFDGASNPNAVPADSFTGGVSEIEEALMEEPVEYEIDELMKPKKKGPGDMDIEQMMQMMQMLGIGGM